jgi:hypothetical protein
MLETIPHNSTLVSRAHTAIEAQNFDLAKRLLLEARDAGDTTCLALLGWMYETGTGVPVDQSIAEGYYREGFAAGDSQSTLFLGLHFLGKFDTKESEKYLKLAAKNLEPVASLTLGRMHHLSLEERLHWLEHGVLVGNVYCMAMSGRLLLRTRPFGQKIKGLWRVFRGYLDPIVYGIRHTNVDALHADKRFHKG